MRIPCLVSVFILLCQALIASGQSGFQDVPLPSSSEDLNFLAAVPNFQAADLQGRVWHAADFKGKLTLINIWGVYCGPCRQEHPMLQRFFNEVKSSNKVQVLTFALDKDPVNVRLYLSKSGLNFPVIVDTQLALRLFPPAGNGIPDSWVINQDGWRAHPVTSWSFGRILFKIEDMSGLRQHE